MANYYEGGGTRFASRGGGGDAGKIFVGGLSWETTVDDLREYFEAYGSISDCTLTTDPNTGRSRGFGFITFSDSACVDKVLGGTHTLQGRSIDPKRAKSRTSGGGGSEPVKKLFVGGLDQDLSEQEIRDYFSKFGKIEDLHLPIDRETNERRPFCFITFESEDVAERVLGNTNHSIAGKDIDVKKAKTDQNRGGRGGGRGGGFGGGFGGSGGSYGNGGGGYGGGGRRGGGGYNQGGYGSGGSYGSGGGGYGGGGGYQGGSSYGGGGQSYGYSGQSYGE